MSLRLILVQRTRATKKKEKKENLKKKKGNKINDLLLRTSERMETYMLN